MKTEFLKNLGLDQEAINQIMAFYLQISKGAAQMRSPFLEVV